MSHEGVPASPDNQELDESRKSADELREEMAALEKRGNSSEDQIRNPVDPHTGERLTNEQLHARKEQELRRREERQKGEKVGSAYQVADERARGKRTMPKRGDPVTSFTTEEMDIRNQPAVEPDDSRSRPEPERAADAQSHDTDPIPLAEEERSQTEESTTVDGGEDAVEAERGTETDDSSDAEDIEHGKTREDLLREIGALSDGEPEREQVHANYREQLRSLLKAYGIAEDDVGQIQENDRIQVFDENGVEMFEEPVAVNSIDGNQIEVGGEDGTYPLAIDRTQMSVERIRGLSSSKPESHTESGEGEGTEKLDEEDSAELRGQMTEFTEKRTRTLGDRIKNELRLTAGAARETARPFVKFATVGVSAAVTWKVLENLPQIWLNGQEALQNLMAMKGVMMFAGAGVEGAEGADGAGGLDNAAGIADGSTIDTAEYGMSVEELLDGPMDESAKEAARDLFGSEYVESGDVNEIVQRIQEAEQNIENGTVSFEDNELLDKYHDHIRSGEVGGEEVHAYGEKLRALQLAQEAGIDITAPIEGGEHGGAPKASTITITNRIGEVPVTMEIDGEKFSVPRAYYTQAEQDAMIDAIYGDSASGNESGGKQAEGEAAGGANGFEGESAESLYAQTAQTQYFDVLSNNNPEISVGDIAFTDGQVARAAQLAEQHGVNVELSDEVQFTAHGYIPTEVTVDGEQVSLEWSDFSPMEQERLQTYNEHHGSLDIPGAPWQGEEDGSHYAERPTFNDIDSAENQEATEQGERLEGASEFLGYENGEPVTKSSADAEVVQGIETGDGYHIERVQPYSNSDTTILIGVESESGERVHQVAITDNGEVVLHSGEYGSELVEGRQTQDVLEARGYDSRDYHLEFEKTDEGILNRYRIVNNDTGNTAETWTVSDGEGVDTDAEGGSNRVSGGEMSAPYSSYRGDSSAMDPDSSGAETSGSERESGSAETSESSSITRSDMENATVVRDTEAMNGLESLGYNNDDYHVEFVPDQNGVDMYYVVDNNDGGVAESWVKEMSTEDNE